MKKYLTIAAWSLLIIGLMVSLSFVESRERSMPLQALQVNISQDDENYFIDKSDVEQIIHDRGDSVLNQSVSSFNVPALEQILNSHPAIAKAEVYTTINGELKIDIQQRKPIVRIINKYFDSYYIDENGRLMPLSDKFTSKTLVINGNLDESYARFYQYSIKDIENDTNISKTTLLDELYELSQYIYADTFWRAQIQQVYVNEEQKIELIPRVGDHRIILGEAVEIDKKFKKLLIFYKEGLNTTGWWDVYSTINLEYKNQVVCVKKEKQPIIVQKNKPEVEPKIEQQEVKPVVGEEKKEEKKEKKKNDKPKKKNTKKKKKKTNQIS